MVLVPSAAVQNVSTVVIGSSVNISWLPPSIGERRGVIRRYTITLSVVVSASNFTMVEIVNVTEPAVQFSKLQPFTPYRYEVQAGTLASLPAGPAAVGFIRTPESSE